jgi:hypothetical protein
MLVMIGSFFILKLYGKLLGQDVEFGVMPFQFAGDHCRDAGGERYARGLLMEQ